MNNLVSIPTEELVSIAFYTWFFVGICISCRWGEMWFNAHPMIVLSSPNMYNIIMVHVFLFISGPIGWVQFISTVINVPLNYIFSKIGRSDFISNYCFKRIDLFNRLER